MSASAARGCRRLLYITQPLLGVGSRIERTEAFRALVSSKRSAVWGTVLELVAEQGQTVKAGDPIVRVDLDRIRALGYDLITPVILTAPSPVAGVRMKTAPAGPVRAAVDPIFTVTP